MTDHGVKHATTAAPEITTTGGKVFAAAVLLALWLASRPYPGIIHDSRIYMVQALARLGPGLENDLLFRYGSQDSFTVYGYLLSGVLGLFDIEITNFLLSIAGQLCWICASLFFVSLITKSTLERSIALAAIIILPSTYSGLSAFHYAEPFQTPRIFAEALVLCSITSAMKSTWWRSTLALGIALMIHPLMALPGIGIVFLLATRDRRSLWLLVPASLIAVVCLTLAEVEPFVRLTQRIDGDWWDIVAQYNRVTLISGWSPSDLSRLTAQTVLVMLIFRQAPSVERGLLWPVVAVASAGLVLALVGGAWLHNQFILDVQFARATWLLGYVINLLTGLLLLRAFRRTDPYRCYLSFGIIVFAASCFFPPAIMLAAPIIVTIGIFIILQRPSDPLSRPAELVTFAVALVVGFLLIELSWVQISTRLTYLALQRNWFLNTGATLMTLVAAWLFYCERRKLAIFLLTFTIASCLVNYDQRSQRQQFIEKRRSVPDNISTLIERSRHIYWEDGVEFLWLDFQIPSYYSVVQGAGALFYRDTALEFYRRGLPLSHLNTTEFIPAAEGAPIVHKVDPAATGPISRAQLQAVCAALPDLDLLILINEIPGATHLVWRTPFVQYANSRTADGRRVLRPFDRYYFYKCGDFRPE